MFALLLWQLGWPMSTPQLSSDMWRPPPLALVAVLALLMIAAMSSAASAHAALWWCHSCRAISSFTCFDDGHLRALDIGGARVVSLSFATRLRVRLRHALCCPSLQAVSKRFCFCGS